MTNKLANFFSLSLLDEKPDPRTDPGPAPRPVMYVVTTASAHVPFMGHFEHTLASLAAPGVEYWRVLLCVEDAVDAVTANSMEAAFQLAKDFCYFNEIVRSHAPPNTATRAQAFARTGIVFGNLCGDLVGQPNNRLLVVTCDSELAQEMDAYTKDLGLDPSRVRVLDVTKMEGMRPKVVARVVGRAGGRGGSAAEASEEGPEA